MSGVVVRWDDFNYNLDVRERPNCLGSRRASNILQEWLVEQELSDLPLQA